MINITLMITGRVNYRRNVIFMWKWMVKGGNDWNASTPEFVNAAFLHSDISVDF
jgi:hypothetical protein